MIALIEALRESPGFLQGSCVALGLVAGSFLNVVIHRLPEMMRREWRTECRALLELPDEPAPPLTLSKPGSRCPACKAPIRPWQNIPLLSWLMLRGRCAACGSGISVRYPLVELLSGVIAGVCAWRFGWTPMLGAALLLSWTLIALAGIDLDTQLLPDDLTLPLLWLGLLIALAGVGVPLADAVIGAMAGYLSLWLVFHLFRLATGKEGMGYGDFKLLGALGAWLGWQMLPLVILLSSAVGALVGLGLILLRQHDRRIPISFGPYLAAAGWLALIWGPQLMAWYPLARP